MDEKHLNRLVIPLFLFHSVVLLAWYVLIISFCLVTYCHLRLASLPWIVGVYATGLIAEPLTQFLVSRIFAFGVETKSIVFTPAGLLVLGVSSLQHLSNLLLALLAFSEVAFIVSRAFPDFDSWLMRLLMRTHRHVGRFGLATILMTAAVPLLPLGFWYFNGPSVPQ